MLCWFVKISYKLKIFQLIEKLFPNWVCRPVVVAGSSIGRALEINAKGSGFDSLPDAFTLSWENLQFVW